LLQPFTKELILLKYFHKWLDSRQGATAIEYGLIAGGISLVIIAAVFLSGDSIRTLFENLGNILHDASSQMN
jgi:pilus assembly protein Flp/PilA